MSRLYCPNCNCASCKAEVGAGDELIVMRLFKNCDPYYYKTFDDPIIAEWASSDVCSDEVRNLNLTWRDVDGQRVVVLNRISEARSTITALLNVGVSYKVYLKDKGLDYWFIGPKSLFTRAVLS